MRAREWAVSACRHLRGRALPKPEPGGRMAAYIAGKITGDPRYRRKFRRAARRLRRMGFAAVNPAVLPDGLPYDACIRISRAMLAECEMIALLPDWGESPGARAELEAARAAGKMAALL
jgi:hypothetical protein